MVTATVPTSAVAAIDYVCAAVRIAATAGGMSAVHTCTGGTVGTDDVSNYLVNEDLLRGLGGRLGRHFNEST